MIISLDMYQTLFAAVCVLMLGRFLKARIGFLEKFCIPAPVIGGVLFAVFTCLCYVTGIAEFEFDDILKEVCMVFFFTSVGFQANLKVLKSGGKSLILFLGLVAIFMPRAGHARPLQPRRHGGMPPYNFIAIFPAPPLLRAARRLFCCGHGPRPAARRCARRRP